VTLRTLATAAREREARKAAKASALQARLARAWDEGHDAARTYYAGGPKEANPYDEVS